VGENSFGSFLKFRALERIQMPPLFRNEKWPSEAGGEPKKKITRLSRRLLSLSLLTDFSFFQREDGSWLIDGQYPLSDFLRKFDLAEFESEFNSMLFYLKLHMYEDALSVQVRIRVHNLS
jgi:hypothetical protein